MLYPPRLPDSGVLAPQSVLSPTLILVPAAQADRVWPDPEAYKCWLKLFLAAFILWDTALVFCNYRTFVAFMESNNDILIFVAMLAIMTTILKWYSACVGVSTLLSPKNDFLEIFEDVQIIVIFFNTATVAFGIWIGHTRLTAGSLCVVLFDFVLHVGVAGLSALIWRNNHVGVMWSPVPQQMEGY